MTDSEVQRDRSTQMHRYPSHRPAAAVVCAAVVLPILVAAAPAAVARGGVVVDTANGAVAVETAAVRPDDESVAVDGVDARSLEVLRTTDASAAPEGLTAPAATGAFQLVGATWDHDASLGQVAVEVRLREGGTWTTWTALPHEEGGPTPGSDEARRAAARSGTEPLLTDGADGVQVRVDTTSGRLPDDLRVVLVDGGEGSAAATEASGVVEAGSGGARMGSLAATSAAAASARPTVITRAQWGADESLARGSSQNAVVTAMTIHHTASSNGYSSPAGAMAQLRSIYAYHTTSLGWADIGYNFVVDKFGTVYEGRRGSITGRPVGAHAAGFNTSTMGISALGNYEEARPSAAMVESIAAVAAWKLGEAGLDPSGSTTLTSAGGGSRYAVGTKVSLPRIFRHMDVGYTACPGVNLSAQMSAIRARASRLVQAAVPAPAPAPTPAPKPAAFRPGIPLVGDWDGDGRDQLGWFRNGEITLRTGPTETVRYTFGRAGDVPVVGDFDDDGVDSVGIFRNGDWHLRNSHSSGPVDSYFRFGSKGARPLVGRWGGKGTGIGVVTPEGRWLLKGGVGPGSPAVNFSFGKATDVPMVGDWDGNGSDTPGVQRGAERYVKNSQSPQAPVTPFRFGSPGDLVVVGDFDADGRDSVGVVRSDLFMWRDDLRGGGATASIRFAG